MSYEYQMPQDGNEIHLSAQDNNIYCYIHNNMKKVTPKIMIIFSFFATQWHRKLMLYYYHYMSL